MMRSKPGAREASEHWLGVCFGHQLHVRDMGVGHIRADVLEPFVVGLAPAGIVVGPDKHHRDVELAVHDFRDVDVVAAEVLAHSAAPDAAGALGDCAETPTAEPVTTSAAAAVNVASLAHLLLVMPVAPPLTPRLGSPHPPFLLGATRKSVPYSPAAPLGRWRRRTGRYRVGCSCTAVGARPGAAVDGMGC